MRRNNLTMKSLGVCAIFVIAFCSCRNEKAPSLTFKDSFPAFDEAKSLRIPQGFRIDTFKTNDIKNNAEITLILPRIDTSISFISNKISAFIDSTKAGFYERIAYEKDEEDQFGGAMVIEPLMLYASKEKISIILRSYFHTASMIRHFWTYCTINYDLKAGKEIGFNDYFKQDRDTAFWPGIINASIGLRNSWGIPNGHNDFSEMKFGFDEENIYFCFDMFELSSIPLMGAVNRKVITHHLND